MAAIVTLVLLCVLADEGVSLQLEKITLDNRIAKQTLQLVAGLYFNGRFIAVALILVRFCGIIVAHFPGL